MVPDFQWDSPLDLTHPGELAAKPESLCITPFVIEFYPLEKKAQNPENRPPRSEA